MTKQRALLAVAAAALLCAAARAAAAGPVPAPSYEARLAEIEALGPRAENGPAERAVLDLLESALRGAGIATEVSDFSAARGGYSGSRIVEALIPGASEEEMAFIAPLDSWQDASSAGEGAAGLAFALSEAERIAASGRKPALSLRFVFLGAERRGRKADGEEASLGSRTWIASAPVAPLRAVIYLNLDAGFSSVTLRNAGEGRLSPYWHFERTRSALESAGIDPRIDANRLLIYRLGLADRYGPAAPYLAADIPAVELRGSAAGGPAIRGDSLSAFVDALVAANAAGFPSTWDFHYLPFAIGRRSFTIRETSYVAFVLAFCAAVAAAFLAFTVARRAQVKPFLSRLPLALGQTAALYIALAAVFLAGNGIARFDSLALGSQEAWLLAPRVFAAARIVSSLLLFLALVSILVERRTITPNPFFYELTALICLGVDVLVFSAINLSISLPFIWAFIVVAASLATRKAWATIAAYGVMYAPIAFLALEMALDPERAVYGRVISSGPGGAFALAAFLLPFYAFTASPLLFFAPRGALARKRTAFILAVLGLAVEGAALVVAGQAGSPGDASGPARGSTAIVSESLDQDFGRFETRLKDRRRLGAGHLFRGPLELDYAASGDAAVMGGLDARRLMEISQSRTFFLDRCTRTIAISFAEPPYAARLVLKGEEELRIYDCGLPYRVSLDGRSAEIFPAVNPGPSLVFPVTVPRSFAADLEVEVEYLEPIVPYAFPDGTKPRPGSFTAKSTARLAGNEGAP